MYRFAYNKEIGAITQVFWKHGYVATALDMLSEARPSLYATYGDKVDMYLASLLSRPVSS